MHYVEARTSRSNSLSHEIFFMFTWLRGEGVGKSLLKSWPPECCPFVYL